MMVDEIECLTHQPMDARTTDISIWIIDDHHDFRDTIQEFVGSEEGLSCPHSFASCEEAIDFLTNSKEPDVILIDLTIPGRMSGVEGTKVLHTLAPDVKIILMTMHLESEIILEAIKAGGVGYLFKMASLNEIISGIHMVKNLGFIPPTPLISQQILNNIRSGKKKYGTLTSHLSLKENEILNLLAIGNSMLSISQELNLKMDMVESNIRNIYHLLHLTN